MKLLRAFHLVHRWLGIALGLVVLVWFASGIVMIYVAYPALSEPERLAALTPLNAAQIKLNANAAWALSGGGAQNQPEAVRLNNVLSRPAYHFLAQGQWRSVWADNGQTLQVTAPAALLSAQAMAGMQRGDVTQIDLDQWTFGGGLDAHRPLYRVAFDDDAGHVIYVSSRTGEIVRDTTRSERAWNWLGAIMHWIYFEPLRAMREPWRQVVMCLSGAAFALVVLGAVLGIQRVRLRKPYSGGRVSPYRGWKRWHHLLGLGVGSFALTWLFSGWLSVNPFGLFNSANDLNADRRALAQGAISQMDLHAPLLQLNDMQAGTVLEAEWLRFAGQGYIHTHLRQGATVTALFSIAAPTQAIASLPLSQLVAAAAQVRPQLAVSASTWLAEGDLYYYRHHDDKPLPVVRVDFDDPAQSSFYIDPATGRLLDTADNTSRVYRWLFYALHRFDFPWLTQSRPLWDVLVIGLCLFGFSAALSGVVLAWRRLRKISELRKP